MSKEELIELRVKISAIRGVSNHKDKICEAIDKRGLKLRKTHCASCLRDYLQMLVEEIDERIKELE